MKWQGKRESGNVEDDRGSGGGDLPGGLLTKGGLGTVVIVLLISWVDDIEEAINAATAIGDDHLQKQFQGTVVPDSFTHGTSAQRVGWFTKGFQTGDTAQGIRLAQWSFKGWGLGLGHFVGG